MQTRFSSFIVEFWLVSVRSGVHKHDFTVPIRKEFQKISAILDEKLKKCETYK